MTGRIIDADVDALANVDRLTALVAGLKAERDDALRIIDVWRGRHGVLVDDAAALGKRATEAERLAKRWEECAKAFERERDAYKRDYDAEIEGAAEMRRLYGAENDETLRMFVLRVVSERDEARMQVEVERGEKRKSDAQRAELERMLTASETDRDAMMELMLRRVDEADAANERVLVLEGALRDARDGICEIYRHIDEDRESKAMKACKPICDKIDAALAPVLPAETPAVETCKWCSRPPRAGDNVCQQCRDNHAKHSTQMFATMAETPASTCGQQHSILVDYVCKLPLNHAGWHSCGPAPVVRDASGDDIEVTATEFAKDRKKWLRMASPTRVVRVVGDHGVELVAGGSLGDAPPPKHDHAECDRILHATTAERDRLRADLASLSAELDEANGKLDAAGAEIAKLRCSDCATVEAAHAATTAKLGRAEARIAELEAQLEQRK